MARQEVGGPGWLALGLKERGQHLGLRKPLGPQVSESLAEPFPLFFSDWSLSFSRAFCRKHPQGECSVQS